MLILSLHKGLPVLLALLALTAGSGGVAIADVTIDAVVAQNSITHPSLASDMQSLCGLSSSVGRLLGFVVSGQLVHWIGSQVTAMDNSLETTFVDFNRSLMSFSPVADRRGCSACSVSQLHSCSWSGRC